MEDLAHLDHAAELNQKIANRTARIGIAGLGYVGLPLALRFNEAGFPTLGLDINHKHVAQLQDGVSPYVHIASQSINGALKAGIEFDTDATRIAELDALILCLPTPLDRHRQPNLSFITRSLDTYRPHFHSGMIVSLESTTWPGTTDEVVRPKLEAAGLRIGTDAFLVYSPEREDPGNRDFSLQTIPKVVGGTTTACLQLGEALYGSVVDRTIAVSSTRAAELTKLLENIQRSVNIGLMNEMKVIANEMGLDIFEVIDAAKTKPFGFQPYYPGPGLGGHCIPIDPFYLTWKAKEFGVDTRFIELSGEINTAMPGYVVSGLVEELSLSERKSLNGARILVCGLAYKKNVNDVRESPALAILNLLDAKRAEWDYYDPHVPVIPQTRDYSAYAGKASISWNNLRETPYDAAVIVTDHDAVAYDELAASIPLIIDTRNVFGGKKRVGRANICAY